MAPRQPDLKLNSAADKYLNNIKIWLLVNSSNQPHY
ncbi:protein of unknown function [Rhodovastum atsumiense]|nr:protein of unknown function [Rhodovastum atsumiense]